MSQVNLTNYALLLRNDVVTVSANIRQQEGGLTQKEYTFIADKATAEGLSVGSLVVAYAKGRPVFAVVSRIDKELDIDPNDGIQYAWIANAVQEERVAHNQWKTEELVERLKQKQRANIRQQAAASLGLSNEELLQLTGEKA